MRSETAAQFRVVSVSVNTNSFGLYGVIIMDREGNAFEVGVNYLYKPSKGDIWNGLVSRNGTNLVRVFGVSYEIPEYKGQAPANVLAEVWSPDFAPINSLT